MTIDISVLARQIAPQNTVLVLGAGASIPSGAPSGKELAKDLEAKFKVGEGLGLSLSDIATLIERRVNRRELIEFICNKVEDITPSGGILSIPLLDWAAIFTTNYDTLVEKAFKKSGVPLSVYSSNYDFSKSSNSNSQSLYKFHGTAGRDDSLGFKERMVITGPDYDKVEDFRTILYKRLAEYMHSKSVIIIGNSLEDPDLRKIVDDAVSAKSNEGAPGKIFLLVYNKNDDLAEIYESRGIIVCFGGIDDFFHSVLKEAPSGQLIFTLGDDVLDVAPALQPSTTSVRTELSNNIANLYRMFNGKPATYGDIEHGWVFERDIVGQLESQFVSDEGKPYAVLLGAAGVGKTTAARSVLRLLEARDIPCWEHKADFEVDDNAWIKVNGELSKRKQIGVLFIDDAHHHLRAINRLVERLAAAPEQCLGIIFVSSKPHWNPRIKSPHLFSQGAFYELSRLSDVELGFLLDLLDSSPEIRALVEAKFLGYNRTQRMDRLQQRCDADMFVCLKNIFGYQSIDGIILEEFNSISDDLQNVYRYVAGMQSIGVRVHRESIRRITGLQANQVQRTLEDLDGIVEEYVVSQKEGIYGWSLRA